MKIKFTIECFGDLTEETFLKLVELMPKNSLKTAIEDTKTKSSGMSVILDDKEKLDSKRLLAHCQELLRTGVRSGNRKALLDLMTELGITSLSSADVYSLEQFKERVEHLNESN